MLVRARLFNPGPGESYIERGLCPGTRASMDPGVDPEYDMVDAGDGLDVAGGEPL